MELLLKIVFVLLVHSPCYQAQPANQNPLAKPEPDKGAGNGHGRNTTTSSPATVKATTGSQFPEYKFQSVKCANQSSCQLQLVEAVPLLSEKLLKTYNIGVHGSDESCSRNSKEDLRCCGNLLTEINARLPNASDNTDFAQLLYTSNCSRLICQKRECKYVICQRPNCSPLSTPSSTPSSSPLSTPSPSHFSSPSPSHLSSPSPSPLSTPSPSADTSTSSTNDGSASVSGDEDIQPTTIIIIVVASALAFLVGIGGAFLVLCLCRRWRAVQGSQDSGSEVTSTDGTRTQVLEPIHKDLPELNSKAQSPRDTNYKATAYKATACLKSDEHVYSCLDDHHQATQHNTTTTKTSTTPYDNFRANSPHARKLPTAPALPETYSLATKESPDKTAPVKSSDHCYAKRPESEGEKVVAQMDTVKELETSFSQENQAAGGEYFILEDELKKQTQEKETNEKDKRMDSTTQRTSVSEEAAGQYFTLEREESEINARESIHSRLSDKGECYSPLNLASRCAEDSEYTDLAKANMESEYAEVSGNYLELQSDYSLSKPIS